MKLEDIEKMAEVELIPRFGFNDRRYIVEFAIKINNMALKEAKKAICDGLVGGAARWAEIILENLKIVK